MAFIHQLSIAVDQLLNVFIYAKGEGFGMADETLSATTTSTDLGYEGLIKYTLWSVRDGADSWQKHEREFTYSAT
jgi:hypothetical protein